MSKYELNWDTSLNENGITLSSFSLLKDGVQINTVTDLEITITQWAELNFNYIHPACVGEELFNVSTNSYTDDISVQVKGTLHDFSFKDSVFTPEFDARHIKSLTVNHNIDQSVPQFTVTGFLYPNTNVLVKQ